MLYHHLNVPPARLAEAPEPVAAVIGRALEKNPPARHASAREFAIDLALAAASAYGPGWLAASEVPTSLPEAITEAARGNAAVTTRSPAHPRAAEATAPRPWWSASGADTDTTRRVTSNASPAPAADPPPGGLPEGQGQRDHVLSGLSGAGAQAPGSPRGPLAGSRERGRKYSGAHGSGARGAVALFGQRRNRIGAGVLMITLVAVAVGFALSRTGSGPQPGRAAYSGPALKLELSEANGLAIGPDGTIVVSDSSAGRILTLSQAGAVQWLAGARKPSSTVTPGATPQPAADTDARRKVLDSPAAVTVDKAGAIYVATGTYDGQIFKITKDGAITLVAGSGPDVDGFTGNNGTATAAELSYPRGVAVDRNGDVLVSDSARVRRVTVATGRIAAIAGSVTGSGTTAKGTSGDNGPAVNALLTNPTDLVIAGDGTIYVLDRDAKTVRKISSRGVISRFAGTSPPAAGAASSASTATASPPPVGSIGDGFPATKVTLGDPTGIALAPNGDLYIADYTNNVVRLVSATTGVISTFAGSRTATDAGDGGDAREARVYAPTGIAVDGTGAVYIAQYGGIIRRVGRDGIISTILKHS